MNSQDHRFVENRWAKNENYFKESNSLRREMMYNSNFVAEKCLSIICIRRPIL
jgi:hypothetical protein